VAEESSIEFYRVLSQNRDEDLGELTQFERRDDITTYEPVLREIMGLFGQAINTSLERTIEKYLQSTGEFIATNGGRNGSWKKYLHYYPRTTPWRDRLELSRPI
jgi:hypothetical protein